MTLLSSWKPAGSTGADPVCSCVDIAAACCIIMRSASASISPTYCGGMLTATCHLLAISAITQLKAVEACAPPSTPNGAAGTLYPWRRPMLLGPVGLVGLSCLGLWRAACSMAVTGALPLPQHMALPTELTVCILPALLPARQSARQHTIPIQLDTHNAHRMMQFTLRPHSVRHACVCPAHAAHKSAPFQSPHPPLSQDHCIPQGCSVLTD